MKFVFFGTDDFSVTVLDELKRAGFMPSLVVTVPDKPKGRGLVLTPPPAKVWAQKNDTAFLQLEKLDSTSTILLASKIVDCFVVASYGKIIPKMILDIPKYGALNVHPSLLPKYRGPSPIESQILNDEKEIGVTIMQMDEQMDHGPTLASWKLDTGNWKNKMPPASELRKILAREGGRLLAEIIPKWIAGEITAVPQDENKATYTKKIDKKDGLIDLAGDAHQNFLKIRAYDSSVGTYFLKDNKRVIIKDAEFENGKLVITRVVPEGKKERDYSVGFSAESGATGCARQIL